MISWTLRYWLCGYRTVDWGVETTMSNAADRAKDTAKRFARGRSTAIFISNCRWAVMVKGWNRRKEDG